MFPKVKPSIEMCLGPYYASLEHFIALTNLKVKLCQIESKYCPSTDKIIGHLVGMSLRPK